MVDANDTQCLTNREELRQSPVLHTAIHNLLDGLRHRDDLEIEVIYGRQHANTGENRWDGCLHYIPVPYTTFPLLGMGAAYIGRTIALLRYLKQKKPDLVHAQGTERESGMVAAWSGIPSVLTLHGNFQEIARTLDAKPWSYMWLNARLEKWIVPRVDGVICISNYTRKLIAPLNPNSIVLPNAVNEKMFNIANNPVQGRVVCLADINLRKNQLAFLKAADKLAADSSSFHVHFWGYAIPGTSYLDEFQKAVAARPWASYHGSAKVDSIPEIIAKAEILVLPSIEDNCPVVILEAMAAGVPVVATNVGGIPDLVTQGETGFLAPAENQDQLVAYIKMILKSPELRARLSSRAKQEASQRFTPEYIARVHAAYYQTVVVKKSSSGK